jgi:hypothetical protein
MLRGLDPAAERDEDESERLIAIASDSTFLLVLKKNGEVWLHVDLKEDESTWLFVNSFSANDTRKRLT